MTKIVIRVRGYPAPQGSKRHVGNGILVESSKRVRPWRDAVRTETQMAMQMVGPAPLAGPLLVQIKFCFLPPKKPRDPTYPLTRAVGDLDKLCRSTIDGLVDGGAMADDAQIVRVQATKMYSDWQGAIVEVRHIA